LPFLFDEQPKIEQGDGPLQGAPIDEVRGRAIDFEGHGKLEVCLDPTIEGSAVHRLLEGAEIQTHLLGYLDQVALVEACPTTVELIVIGPELALKVGRQGGTRRQECMAMERERV